MTRLLPLRLALGLALALTAAPAFADTVLITGSDKGLGLEFARQYAAKGWDVIATARKPDAAKDLKTLAAANKKVVIEKLDVTSDADIAALAAKYKGKPIDLLLNNAGILGNLQTSKIGQLTRKDFLEVMDVNVFGSLAVAQALRDNVAMSKQKKIVAVSSGIGSTTSADRIGPGPYYYRISKAALDMSMRALAQDVKAQGVIVALISPTPADTDMLATYRKTFGMGTMKSATPAEAVTKAIPVIDGIDQAKAAKGMLVADGNVLPW